MSYNNVSNAITRLYRFTTAEDAEDGDGITQAQHDVALDEIVTDVNAMSADIFSRLGLIVIDNFVGDNATTSFALTGSPTGEENLFVYIDGVYQNKSVFTLVGVNLIFSSAPPLNAAIEVINLSNPNAGSTINTFIATDTTPSVAAGNSFFTDSGSLTITDLDDGITGQRITIISKGAVTFDTTGTNLVGSSVDIVTADGDTTEWFCEDGTTWRLLGYVDVSVDNSAGA